MPEIGDQSVMKARHSHPAIGRAAIDSRDGLECKNPPTVQRCNMQTALARQARVQLDDGEMMSSIQGAPDRRGSPRAPRSLMMTSVLVRLALALTVAGMLWTAILGWALA